MDDIEANMIELCPEIDDEEKSFQLINAELDEECLLDVDEIVSLASANEISRIEDQVARVDEEEDIYQSMNAELDEQIARDMEAIKNYLNKKGSDSFNERMEFFNKMSECQIGKQIDASVTNHILYQHTAMGTVKWHECNHCEFKAKEKITLQDHVLEKHTGACWVKCGKCSFKTKSYKDLKQHTTMQHPEKSDFTCDRCSQICSNREQLTQHIRETHKISIIDMKCDKCPFVADDRPSLREHILATHVTLNVSWYKCARCAYRTVRKANLDRHIAYKHSSVF